MVTCAFCQGKGRDPFELLSALSTCQVCKGNGWVEIRPPGIKCAFCKGTGVYPAGVRITCTVCGGKGNVTIRRGRNTCSRCKGRGRAPGSMLPCSECGGIGIV